MRRGQKEVISLLGLREYGHLIRPGGLWQLLLMLMMMLMLSVVPVPGREESVVQLIN